MAPSYNPLYAALAGALSWKILNRHTVAGDYLLLGFSAATATLYFIVKATIPTNAGITTAKAVLTYFLSLSATTIAYRLSPWHPLASYPGPLLWRCSSTVLAAVSYTGRRHIVIDELHRKYGKFVRIGPDTLSISSWTAAPIIYGATKHMVKDQSYALPGHIKGVSLFFKPPSKEEHSKRKRIWANAFASTAIQHFQAPLEKMTDQLTECIETRRNSDGIVDVGTCIAHFSYDFMGEMIFGGSNELDMMKTGDPEDVIPGGKMATVVHDSLGQAPWLIEILWHLPGGEAMHRARRRAEDMMRNRIAAQGVTIRDLSSYLLDGDLRTGEKISRQDLEIEAVQAIPAGSDNTSAILTFAIFNMVCHPDTYRTLQAELDTVFPDPTMTLDHAKLEACSYLNAVIQESLRLGAPFYVPRVVPPQGVVLDDRHVPGGTVVALAAYSQQISEENFYPDPMGFHPQRWLDEGLGPGSILNKSAMFPFSSGPYVCVAKNFAMQEMRHVLARLVLQFDMELPKGFNKEAWVRGMKNMRTTIFDEPLLVKAVRRAQKN
ncbi:cytochrome P450 [Irpex lacteus]|nr:cytochrome P450 [Irpex lacteus]